MNSEPRTQNFFNYTRVLKKQDLKIIAEKPDHFGSLPESVLDQTRRDQLRQIPGLAVGLIADGRDIAAITQTAAARRPDGILPSLSYTGTQYGDWQALGRQLKDFKKKVERNLRIYVAEPVILGAPRFWWALNQRFTRDLYARYKFYPQCYGCRLYEFALRIPLCKYLGAGAIISREREYGCSNGCVRWNEPVKARRYYQTLLDSFGIQWWGDDRRKNGEARSPESKAVLDDQTLSRSWMNCVLEGHDPVSEKVASEKQPGMAAYFENYALPVSAKIISGVLAGQAVDYECVASETMRPVKQTTRRGKKTGNAGGTSSSRTQKKPF